MATRSTIAIEYANGEVAQVYCHWDGYLDNTGKTLLKSYQDVNKLQRLIELGNISSLGPEIGDKHEFECPHRWGSDEYDTWMIERHKVTTFYGRDRGEDNVDAERFTNYEDYCNNAQFEEYNYILRRDGKWYVEFHGEFDGLLTDAFEWQAAQEDS